MFNKVIFIINSKLKSITINYDWLNAMRSNLILFHLVIFPQKHTWGRYHFVLTQVMTPKYFYIYSKVHSMPVVSSWTDIMLLERYLSMIRFFSTSGKYLWILHFSVWKVYETEVSCFCMAKKHYWQQTSIYRKMVK